MSKHNTASLFEIEHTGFMLNGYASACWLWTRTKLNENGYATTFQNKRKQYAHRWLYEMANGPIEAGLEIDHLCRTRHCVRPDHCEATTKTVNVRRGLCTKLTQQQVEEIRRLAALGHTYRDIAKKVGSVHSWVRLVALGKRRI